MCMFGGRWFTVDLSFQVVLFLRAVDCEGATSYRVAPLARIGDGAEK